MDDNRYVPSTRKEKAMRRLGRLKRYIERLESYDTSNLEPERRVWKEKHLSAVKWAVAELEQMYGKVEDFFPDWKGYKHDPSKRKGKSPLERLEDQW